MAATKLNPKAVAKPWGRRDLAPWSALRGTAIGELIYDGGAEAPLLLKTLFTAERLSVQVHPDDATAQAMGLPRGKDEAWIILAAEPGATIALGLRTAVSRDELAAAACDGSIEALLDWRPVQAGDVFFSPAGTIHAIGAGLTLVEVQQNLDLTYRLFDYGRDRSLHVGDGVAAAQPGPWHWQHVSRSLGEGRRSLVEGPSFVIERVATNGRATLNPPAGRATWLAIIGGAGRIDGAPCRAGEVWLAETGTDIEFDGDGDVLLAYPGAGIAPGLWAAARRQAA
ncbi:class I mannose-6-phosphate isomerase [Glacieibacterium frigidum]|uniref:Phosphoheptose isomerase n=1 Tax=Glacieibacterium frigidum TaxID=2593303 RepID=A0A552UIR0_9SPHN|nr:class I mannose-6-phosphate isomerase [Glacieibacterium frigidum]TRW18080.1 phosphoheptose isomerase [Glacieibacterium frigidum]